MDDAYAHRIDQKLQLILNEQRRQSDALETLAAALIKIANKSG